MTSSDPDDVIRFEIHGRARVTALIAAVGVFAVLVAQGILLTLVSTITYVDALGAGSLSDVAPIYGGLWLELLRSTAFVSLPLAAGVFVSFWLIAPIQGGHRLLRLVLRSLLATAVGAALVIAVAVLLAFAGALTGANLTGYAFPGLGGAFRAVQFAVLQGVIVALRSFVLSAPVVVLAALALRDRLRRPALRGHAPVSPAAPAPEL